MRLDLTTGAETFASSTTVTFHCSEVGASTFVEFIGPSVHAAELNGRTLPASAFAGGRIQLEGLATENRLEVHATARYMRDGTGLHRFRDPVDGRHYLHTQFESNDAHRVYACFDQPDLKGTFNFTVRVPQDWVVVSNTTPASRDEGLWVFPSTQPISTYITAIIPGQYAEWHEHHGDIPMALYCRQSLARYFDPDEVFEITRQGLDFFAERFGYPYPFGKYDQVYVPEFSAGAMENAACVTHSERMVFRSRVTEASRLQRAETTLHEMAHMWFGDLVTMRWFNDLWLNESFATYMAYVAMDRATRFKGAWLDFAVKMKTRAKVDDQLPTTHPIVADIPDVDSVHQNFDSITYEKGASVLKQLAAWVGDEPFFAGLNDYFRRHEYGNTELPDFLQPLETASGRDLRQWARVWLEAAGLNTITADLDVQDGRIKAASLRQTAPASHPTLRPHRLRVGLFYADGELLKARRTIELDVDGELTQLDVAGEPAPDLLLPNAGDLAYAKLHLDPRSIKTLTTHLSGIEDPLSRAVGWGAVWDMVRDAQLRARDYVPIALNNIDVEKDSATVTQLITFMWAAIDGYSDPAHRATLRQRLAAAARERALSADPGSDRQLLWTRAFIDAAREPEDVDWVRGLLDGRTTPEGLQVDFAVRWLATQALANIGVAGAAEIAAELERDPTEEGRRAAATALAARPLPEAKAEAWSAVIDGDEVSLAMKRAFAAGFHRADQEHLLEPYVRRYFDDLLPVWESHDIDEGLMFAEWMFPEKIVRQDVIELVEETLAGEGGQLPGPLRRALLEGQDHTSRLLRGREFDGMTGTPAGA